MDYNVSATQNLRKEQKRVLLLLRGDRCANKDTLCVSELGSHIGRPF